MTDIYVLASIIKMRKLYLILCFSVLNLFSQQKEFSSHEVEFFVDGKSKKIRKLEAQILTKNDTLIGEFKDGKLIFPFIKEPFMLKMKVNNQTLSSNEIESIHFINSNSKMLFGKVKNFKKLESAALKNGTEETDLDWIKYSNSFCVVNGSNYFINVNNWTKIKKLIFVIINPQKSSMLTIQQEVSKK